MGESEEGGVEGRRGRLRRGSHSAQPLRRVVYTKHRLSNIDVYLATPYPHCSVSLVYMVNILVFISPLPY